MDINALKGFTPGPWFMLERNNRTRCKEQSYDILAGKKDNPENWEMISDKARQSDALLLAASPDLLTLAKLGLELAEIICDGALSMGNDYRSELEAKARALREKAESL